MKRTGLLTIILLTLWLGATNHCVLEALFSNNSEHSVVGENCPSHSSGDSQGHKEGVRCNSSVTTEVKSLTVLPHNEIFASLTVTVFLLNTVSESYLSFFSLEPAVFNVLQKSSSAELLATLVSPNAPPVSLHI